MDALRSPELDAIEDDTRLARFQRLEKVATRLAVRVAKRAFHELRGRRTLPWLWSNDHFPSAEITIPVRLNLK